MEIKTAKVKFNRELHEAPIGSLLSSLFSIETPCGGHARCGKCRVIARGGLSAPSDAERRLLSEDELARGIRLACLTYIEGDCEVETERVGDGVILSDGASAAITLSPIFENYGVAIDIGTTTLAAKLFDRAGICRAEAVRLNPQSRFGADVISRIEAALGGAAHEIALCIRAALDEMIVELACEAKLSPDLIDRAVITGNTVMLHLLTETSVEPLSHAPFALERGFGETFDAAELGLSSLSPDSRVYLPPCIASFVGADTTCALLASGICRTREPRLLIDIGTNGEMALLREGALTVCSTAAGPAFEGVGISMGMRGARGAIDRVTLVNGAPHAHVIGECAPSGICGSGLVDAIACLLDTEDIDETGFIEDEEISLAGNVVITQQDVRAVQLAKSAICAGIKSLLASSALSPSELAGVTLAGGFGSYLNLKNAERIGLLPDGIADKTTVAGNAALAGAIMLLLDSSCTPECEAIAKGADQLELATNPVFVEEYMQGMLF